MGGTGEGGFFSRNCSSLEGEGLDGPPAVPADFDPSSPSCLMGEKVLLEAPIPTPTPPPPAPAPAGPRGLPGRAMVGPSKSYRLSSSSLLWS